MQFLNEVWLNVLQRLSINHQHWWVNMNPKNKSFLMRLGQGLLNMFVKCGGSAGFVLFGDIFETKTI